MTVDVMQDRAKHYALEWLQEPGNLRIAEYQRPYCRRVSLQISSELFWGLSMKQVPILAPLIWG